MNIGFKIALTGLLVVFSSLAMEGIPKIDPRVKLSLFYSGFSASMFGVS